ncbi:hypothetical protein B0H13DRAFT_2459076 [Mycena leptocephala]|nr:hypothetical protein B0H13DRAFT_2459076 [Mycena leptocephala]
MAQLALTYGSFGDLLETAKLVVKVVRLLRADGRTKLSQERLALATKLQTLNSDLITLDSIAAGVHIDLSSTHTLLVVIRVQAEVEACRVVLTQFLDKLAAPRSFLGSMIVALSKRSNLAGTQSAVGPSGISTSAGRRQGRPSGDRLAAYHDAILNLPIAREVSDNIFCVIDPVGGNIPISLRYCHSYSDLDRIIKAYMQNRQEAGGLYVQRGDYNIVSREGSIISPMEFAETVKAGMQVEMSIIKRKFHAWRERRAQINSSTNPPNTDEATEWFICANPTCRRKYEINEHNGEIVSPEVAQDRSGQESFQPEVFRLVQDYTVRIKGQASHTMSWAEFSTGPAQWTVQFKVHGEVKGVADSKGAAKEEAARQALNLRAYGNWQKETCNCSEFYLERKRRGDD